MIKLFGEQGRENGSAFRDLWDGKLEGWDLGLELQTPIGNRIGHVAVRNAELLLRRERALLREQERYIFAELSESFNELDRAYRLARNNFNLIVAARQRLEAERTRYEVGDGVLQFVLNAQSQVADAETEYFRALVDYNLAVAKIHFSQGTLLDYYGIQLSEGPWSQASYESSAENSRRFRRRHLDYCRTEPGTVSQGRYPQMVLPRDAAEELPPGVPVEDPPSVAPTPAEPQRLPPQPTG